MNVDKILGTVEGAADRAVASQCQSEVAHPKSAHTPGPWAVKLHHGQRYVLCASMDNNSLDATRWIPERDVKAHQRNGSWTPVIADAENAALRVQRDELAAALRGLLDACTVFSKAQNAHDTCRPRPDSPGVLNARAALAKAGAAP